MVDIDAETIKMLIRWRAGWGSMTLDFTRVDAVVFGTLDGIPRNPMSVSEMFTRSGQGAEALATDVLPMITLHRLRHMHATLLLPTRTRRWSKNGSNTRPSQRLWIFTVT